MTTRTDPNDIILTGENNYMRLHDVEDGPMTTRAAHWRVLLSPGGPGHVLFLRSDVTEGEKRIYSDNIAMVRWMQEEISNTGEFFLHPTWGTVRMIPTAIKPGKLRRNGLLQCQSLVPKSN